MAKKEITEFSTYLISALGISWSIILGLLSYIWHSRIKETNHSISELKKAFGSHVLDCKSETGKVDEKIDLCVSKIDFETHKENNRSDISELHKRIDASFGKTSNIQKEVEGLKKKIDGHIKLCDRTHKEVQ